MVSFEEFKKLELKVAIIKAVDNHPNADKLYVVTIDVGGQEKTLVAGIRPYYTPEQLVGRNVVVVNNLEPAQIRGVTSEGMLLAASDEQGIAILSPDRKVETGSNIR
ncbi:methionine--tRNA ligase subunit beta [Candidatus Omnitrophota bacterium]